MATYTSDGSAANIQILHDAAIDGDTIIIPAGEFDWTIGINITKGIILQGAGIEQTIIRDNITLANSNIIKVTTAIGKSYRITGIQFNPSRRTAHIGAGAILVRGNSTSFRLDHCKFDAIFTEPHIIVSGAVTGVIDHNNFIRNATTPASSTLIFYSDAWASALNGDGSWSSPVHWGTAEFLYVEDNLFSVDTPALVKGITDAYSGARYVFRHNNVMNMKMSLGHGTESSGRQRGVRAIEVYSNTFLNTTPTAANLFDIRSGTAVVFNNTSTGWSHPAWGTATVDRTIGYYSFNHTNGWEGVNGLSLWDKNDLTGGPNGDGIYASGIATGGANNKLIVAAAGWTTNQWQGYLIRNLDGGFTDGQGITWPDKFDAILSNTADTILTFQGGVPVFNVIAGQRFEIRKIVQCFDGVGCGLCDPMPPGPVIAHDTHQVLDPLYCWNNTVDCVVANWTNGPTGGATAGVHFINGTAKPGYAAYVYPHPLNR